MDMFLRLYLQEENGPSWKPVFKKSKKYKNWIAILDPKTCPECRMMHGKIWLINETVKKKIPVHFLCRCKIEIMKTVKSGTATINGIDGADWMLMFKNELPNYYVSQKELELLGWHKGDKVSKFTTGKMFFGGIYKNGNQHLPQAEGRVWYEADINYKSGKRNSQRILWSNDGLIFVTYDHYETFYEIT